jgi:antitoxin component HigA of HigAB toxin-antitoxin module
MPGEPKTLRPAQPPLEIQQGRLPTEPAAVQTAAQAYALSTEKLTRVTGSKTDLATLLASPAGLRNAMILREIFGPPRGLQPFEFAGSA